MKKKKKKNKEHVNLFYSVQSCNTCLYLVGYLLAEQDKQREKLWSELLIKLH